MAGRVGRRAGAAGPCRPGPRLDLGDGAAPGPALRAGAEQLVRERRAQVREAAGRLGVRLVLPLGLCFLPAFVLLGLVPVMVSVGAQLAR